MSNPVHLYRSDGTPCGTLGGTISLDEDKVTCTRCRDTLELQRQRRTLRAQNTFTKGPRG